MEYTISNQSLVTITKEQISCDLAGETVVLNYKDGAYYGLDTIGAFVWSIIQQPKTVSEIQSSIINEYAVDPKLCEKDLVELLEQLASRGLVEVKDEKIT